MTFYISPKWIICDFLRQYLTDPRERAEDTNTESFEATTGNKTTFSLTAPSGTVSCITSVTVNGNAVAKWGDYYIDFRNERVIFFDDLTLGDAVVVTYKYGSTNWVFPDKPQKTLASASWPRINILIPAGGGKRLGNYESPVQSDVHFQIDIWAKEKKEGQIFTIDSREYTGEELAEYIAYRITEAFENNINELLPILYDYIPLSSPRDLPFNDELQCHHKVVELMLKTLDIGRLE